MSTTDFLSGGSAPLSVQSDTTNTEIPDWLQQYEIAQVNKASQIAGAGTPVYSGQRVADMNSDQNNAISQVQGLNNGAGTTAINSAIAGEQALGSAGFNQDQFNQYLSPYTQNVVDQIATQGDKDLTQTILPSVQDEFIKSGAYGSGRQGTITNKAISDENANILNAQTAAQQSAQQSAMTAYEQGQSNQNTAYNQEASAGAALNSSSLNNANALLNAGNQEQNQTQNNLNTAYSDFENQANAPLQGLALTQDAIRGLALPTSTSTYYPSTYNGSSSGLSSIASLLQALGASSSSSSGTSSTGYAKGGQVSDDTSSTDPVTILNTLLDKYNTNGSTPNQNPTARQMLEQGIVANNQAPRAVSATYGLTDPAFMQAQKELLPGTIAPNTLIQQTGYRPITLPGYASYQQPTTVPTTAGYADGGKVNDLATDLSNADAFKNLMNQLAAQKQLNLPSSALVPNPAVNTPPTNMAPLPPPPGNIDMSQLGADSGIAPISAADVLGSPSDLPSMSAPVTGNQSATASSPPSMVAAPYMDKSPYVQDALNQLSQLASSAPADNTAVRGARAQLPTDLQALQQKYVDQQQSLTPYLAQPYDGLQNPAAVMAAAAPDPGRYQSPIQQGLSAWAQGDAAKMENYQNFYDNVDKLQQQIIKAQQAGPEANFADSSKALDKYASDATSNMMPSATLVRTQLAGQYTQALQQAQQLAKDPNATPDQVIQAQQQADSIGTQMGIVSGKETSVDKDAAQSYQKTQDGITNTFNQNNSLVNDVVSARQVIANLPDEAFAKADKIPWAEVFKEYGTNGVPLNQALASTSAIGKDALINIASTMPRQTKVVNSAIDNITNLGNQLGTIGSKTGYSDYLDTLQNSAQLVKEQSDLQNSLLTIGKGQGLDSSTILNRADTEMSKPENQVPIVDPQTGKPISPAIVAQNLAAVKAKILSDVTPSIQAASNAARLGNKADAVKALTAPPTSSPDTSSGWKIISRTPAAQANQ